MDQTALEEGESALTAVMVVMVALQWLMACI